MQQRTSDALGELSPSPVAASFGNTQPSCHIDLPFFGAGGLLPRCTGCADEGLQCL